VSKTVLATGGAGFIGSHVAVELLAAGCRVVILDNFSNSDRSVPARIAAIGVGEPTVIEGDVRDPSTLNAVFASDTIDAVVHLAGLKAVGESVTDPLKYYWNNTAEPIALLQVMQENDCKVFVFSSTCATYGAPARIPIDESNPQNPINPYGHSKLMVERILRDCDHAWGLRSACLRYFNASGCSGDGLIGEDHNPETHLIPRVLMAITGEIDSLEVYGTDYPTPDGTCIRDYIHVEDLAEAHGLALGHLLSGKESLRCNLGTGQGISVKEIISAAEQVTGKEVPVRFAPRREGDPPELVADPSLAKSALGWQAKHRDVLEIVGSAWAWMNGPNHGRYPE